MAYIEIGATPSGESCAQLGSNDYGERAREECAVFARMLYRLFPAAQKAGLNFVTRAHPHDFGTYYEVAAQYSEGGAAEELAFTVDEQAPEFWDDIARYELVWHERRRAYLAAKARGEIEAVPEKYQHLPSLSAQASLAELMELHPL